MRPRHRLRSAEDFRRVVRRGRSVAGPGFLLYHLPREGREPPRFGFSVSRRIGSAVRRNRIRRLLREACRTLIPRIEGSADVVIVVRDGADRWELAELEHELHEAAGRAGLTDPLHTKDDTSR